MDRPRIKVAFEKGRAFAAYCYLARREGDRSVRTEEVGAGFLVDFAADGRSIGIEIPSPSAFDADRLNELLVRLAQTPLEPEEAAKLSLP